MTNPEFSTHQLQVLIAERYGADSGKTNKFAVFFELRNGTGFPNQTRSLDAFVLNLYPSERHARYAFEIKVSRSDFLRELNQPHKRMWGMEVSNEFWFVCSPGIAKTDEIPEGCGLLVPTKTGKLRALKRAQWRDSRDFTMTEIAAIARQSKRDVYTDLIWRYADRKMTRDELGELIAVTFEDEIHRRIEDKSKAIAEKRISDELMAIRSALAAYSSAMLEAGVSPPEWMSNPDRLMRECLHFGGGDPQYRNWTAASWVAENVKTIERSMAEKMVKMARVHSSDVMSLADRLEKALK